MFKRIVVGVDEREGGRDAIALARKLLSRDGELSLVHVLAHNGHGHEGKGAGRETSGWEHAADLLEKEREQAGIDAHLRWRVSPSVGRGLHELCEVIGADLLVVGSSRRGLVGRVLMGDDTGAALNGAPCAIAIAPTAYADEAVAMREIGVGYDGSPESDRALELARHLSAEKGARVSAFQAVVIPVSFLSAGAQLVTEAIDSVVTETRERISALGGVEAHAAYGDPAEELALYSASLDLLIVGSRGYGPIGRLIHGSTSRRLARMARCPLLVLPRSVATIEAHDAAGPGHETAVPA